MKLKTLVTEAAPVAAVTGQIVDDTSIAENIREVFTAFEDYGYSNIVDMLLKGKYGDRELLFTDEEIEEEDYMQPIFAYLYPRWRYIDQCMTYLASEYNPIENYSGTENETTEYDVKERKFTKGEQTNTHTEPQDVTQTIEGQQTNQVTPAQKTVTTTTDKQTTTNKVAPFDSSDFSNREQTVVSGDHEDGATQVQQVSSQLTADQYVNGQKTDTVTNHYGMVDGYEVTITEGEREDTDAAHKDKTTRELTRHGNLGLMVESQMMTYDSDFWRRFAWLDDRAHNLAILLAQSVWSM